MGSQSREGRCPRNGEAMEDCRFLTVSLAGALEEKEPSGGSGRCPARDGGDLDQAAGMGMEKWVL